MLRGTQAHLKLVLTSDPCWAVQVSNVECLEGDHIKFDFLGKDSIRYENEVKAHPKVWRLVEKFCRKDGGNKGEPGARGVRS